MTVAKHLRLLHQRCVDCFEARRICVYGYQAAMRNLIFSSLTTEADRCLPHPLCSIAAAMLCNAARMEQGDSGAEPDPASAGDEGCGHVQPGHTALHAASGRDAAGIPVHGRQRSTGQEGSRRRSRRGRARVIGGGRASSDRLRLEGLGMRGKWIWIGVAFKARPSLA